LGYGARSRYWFVLVAIGLAVLAPCGCGGGPPRAPTIMRPLDQPHAVQVMARVFREFGLEPVRNRLIHFGQKDLQLNLDVASKERRFGIAYISWQDADQLGDELPKRHDPSAILVVRGSG
jgi:hypothetical protein